MKYFLTLLLFFGITVNDLSVNCDGYYENSFQVTSILSTKESKVEFNLVYFFESHFLLNQKKSIPTDCLLYATVVHSSNVLMRLKSQINQYQKFSFNLSYYTFLTKKLTFIHSLEKLLFCNMRLLKRQMIK